MLAQDSMLNEWDQMDASFKANEEHLELILSHLSSNFPLCSFPSSPLPTIVHVQQPPPQVPVGEDAESSVPVGEDTCCQMSSSPRRSYPLIFAGARKHSPCKRPSFFRLHRLCDTNFRYLSDAIGHAYRLARIDKAEADRLDDINRAGNRARA